MKGFKSIIFIFGIVTGVGLVSCSSNVAQVEAYKTPGLVSNIIEEDIELSKAQEFANKFTIDKGSDFGKEIKSEWEKNSEDVEIAAMYYYYSALSYDNSYDKDNARESIKHISPDYKGVMRNDIYEYAIEMFGSEEQWQEEYLYKLDNINKTTDEQVEKIKVWIQERYDFYDEYEGKYCGDKYTDSIFQEAGRLFNYTASEIYYIWSDMPL